MLRAALGRFLTLLGVALAVTIAGSALLGVAAGASLNRAISLGLYLVGVFLLIAGFFVGNRGPARFAEDTGQGGLFGRGLRRATAEERRESIATSVIFVTLGLALVVAGILVDTRYELV